MERIIQELKEILRSNLITIAEYGKEGKQHLIVIKKLDSSTLKNLKPLIKNFYKKTKSFPLLLTHEELTDGLDVFPLEFLNIKLNHIVLYGEDIFNNLVFDKRHIRRQLEFEFRSKLITLRQGYLEVGSKKELKIILEKAIPTLLPILNGLLYLKDIDIPEPIGEILDLISKKYRINIDILRKIKNKDQDLDTSVKELVILLATIGEILDEVRV